MCVALAALEATVQVSGPQGERSIPFAEFHRLPGDTPEMDTTLRPARSSSRSTCRRAGSAQHYTYLKLRDRLSYAFALVSVAAALELDGDTVKTARLALGGVAHKPWRNREAEALLVGQARDPARASRRRPTASSPRPSRSRRTASRSISPGAAIVRGLEQAAAGTPQSLSDKRIQ